MLKRLFQEITKGVIAILFCFILALESQAQNVDTKALKLVVFSGSDWCIPCIKFERNVREDSTFSSFSKKYLAVTIADFPQHKKLPEEVIERNEELAEQYNPDGIFPLVILIDDKGEVLTQIKTNKVTAQEVIDQIKVYLPKESLVERSKSALLMGSSFYITLVGDERNVENLLEQAISEISEIESWLSSWQEGSITSRLNDSAGTNPIQVSDQFYALVKRCMQISELTQGAFDISFPGLGGLYVFDGGEHELPSPEKIEITLKHIGHTHIQLLKDNFILLNDPEMSIGFGAVGKGYAADQVKKRMIEAGVQGGVINASGDLTSWGTRADGRKWNVAIPDPLDKSEIMLWLPISNKAVATSGDYEKFFINNNIRYSHIINPKTGLPVIGSNSVSVISNSAELSDALATAISVMGPEIGLNLINQLDGVECVFIDENRKLHFSEGLKTYEN